MTPEEKLQVLTDLLKKGAEIRTYYKNRRVVSIERPSERYVVLRYEGGGADKLYILDFARRRFVVLL